MTGLILAAVTIEALVCYANCIIYRDMQRKCVAAIVLGVMMAVAFRLDVFGPMGLYSQIPFLEYVLTGVLLSRGSNYAADLVRLANIKRK